MNLYLYELSLDDLENLLAKVVRNELQNSSKKELATYDNEKIHGIRGLAKYLKCSVNSAQDFKDSHPEVVHKVGKKLFFFPTEVNEASRPKSKKF